jgi:hypothetical protein
MRLAGAVSTPISVIIGLRASSSIADVLQTKKVRRFFSLRSSARFLTVSRLYRRHRVETAVATSEKKA